VQYQRNHFMGAFDLLKNKGMTITTAVAVVLCLIFELD